MKNSSLLIFYLLLSASILLAQDGNHHPVEQPNSFKNEVNGLVWLQDSVYYYNWNSAEYVPSSITRTEQRDQWGKYYLTCCL